MGASTVVLEVITIEESNQKLGRIKQAGAHFDPSEVPTFFTTGPHEKNSDEVLSELEEYCDKRGIHFRQLATCSMSQGAVRKLLKQRLQNIS